MSIDKIKMDEIFNMVKDAALDQSELMEMTDGTLKEDTAIHGCNLLINKGTLPPAEMSYVYMRWLQLHVDLLEKHYREKADTSKVLSMVHRDWKVPGASTP